MARDSGYSSVGGVVVVLFLSALVAAISACQAPTAPLVPDSPEQSPFPEDNIPVMSSGGRARLRSESLSEVVSADPHHGEPFQGQLEGREERGFWSGVADLIGFPFRAVGWLVQSIF